MADPNVTNSASTCRCCPAALHAAHRKRRLPVRHGRRRPLVVRGAGLAITAGCLATLQPLVKFLAFKLGLRSHPSLPTPTGYGNQKRIKEGVVISVRKSFTHKTEPTTPGNVLDKRVSTCSQA